MRKQQLFLLIAGLAMGLTACTSSTVSKEQVQREVGTAVEYTGDKFITIAETDQVSLQLNPSSGTFRYEDLATGHHIDSNMADVEGVTDKNALSDLIMTYFTGSATDLYGNTSSMDSKSYAIDMENLTFEKIDNGVRMVYNLGSDTVTYKDFPTLITKERMEELVLQYLDESDTKTVTKTAYRYSQKSGLYSRKYSEENKLSGLAAGKLYSIFYEVGHYSYEELEADATEHGTTDDLPNKQEFKMTVDVYLDGDDLVVHIPTDEIIYNLEEPLGSITFFPYMLATDSTDGYMFVPDGSGALINLDSNYTGLQYSARYYGGDKLINAATYTSYNNLMNLPIYGIKYDDFAVLGIIEDGAEVATLSTEVNGYRPALPYAREYLRFVIRDVENTASFTGSTTSFTQRMTSDDYFTGDITVRYRLLTGDDANYNGMAKSYQSYLIDEGVLTVQEAEEDAPIFVDFLGEIDKELYFLGIPYEGNVSLTTFADAKAILEDMTANGIKNIKVQYTGIANEGLNQRAVENVKVSSALGGTSGLKELASYIDSIGGEFFPDFQLQTAYTDDYLSKEERAFFITEEIAQIYNFNLVNNKAETSADYPLYIIAPTYIPDYISKFMNSYNKLGISGLSTSDFMTFISANYKKGANISMANAVSYYQEALAKLDESYTMVFSNPTVLAYGAADYITDLPSGNSGLRVLDAKIPFTQLVLNGCVSYSTDALNSSTSDVRYDMMKCMETQSIMKFRFIAADTTILQDTTGENIFMAEYGLWNEKVADYYAEYNEFYQKVKGTTIVSHEIIDENDDYVKVVYSNGMTIYFNYTELDAVLEGVSVAAKNYVIQ
ncbi:MAG: DUF5696 domain-containing protein [Lachnospiraceae bacterium]